MKFVLFVEGATERALKPFFAKWLNSRLSQNIGIDIVHFDGAGDMIKASPTRANLSLNAPKQDVIAVIGLLDWYGLPPSVPKLQGTLAEQYKRAKQHLEQQVGHPKFKQHFAVHETEAWLLSQPSIFPAAVAEELASRASRPETINSQEPPSKLLTRLYKTKLHKDYKKVTEASNPFPGLDPANAYARCPHLKAMLDEMQQLAQEAQ